MTIFFVFYENSFLRSEINKNFVVQGLPVLEK